MGVFFSYNSTKIITKTSNDLVWTLDTGLWDPSIQTELVKTEVTAISVVWMISVSFIFRGNESVTRLR